MSDLIVCADIYFFKKIPFQNFPILKEQQFCLKLMGHLNLGRINVHAYRAPGWLFLRK